MAGAARPGAGRGEIRAPVRLDPGGIQPIHLLCVGRARKAAERAARAGRAAGAPLAATRLVHVTAKWKLVAGLSFVLAACRGTGIVEPAGPGHQPPTARPPGSPATGAGGSGSGGGHSAHPDDGMPAPAPPGPVAPGRVTLHRLNRLEYD